MRQASSNQRWGRWTKLWNDAASILQSALRIVDMMAYNNVTGTQNVDDDRDRLHNRNGLNPKFPSPHFDTIRSIRCPIEVDRNHQIGNGAIASNKKKTGKTRSNLAFFKNQMIRFGWLERELTDVSGTNREALTNKPNNETNTQTTSSSNSKRTGCFGSWEMRGRGGEIDVKKKTR